MISARLGCDRPELLDWQRRPFWEQVTGFGGYFEGGGVKDQSEGIVKRWSAQSRLPLLEYFAGILILVAAHCLSVGLIYVVALSWDHVVPIKCAIESDPYYPGLVHRHLPLIAYRVSYFDIIPVLQPGHHLAQRINTRLNK